MNYKTINLNAISRRNFLHTSGLLTANFLIPSFSANAATDYTGKLATYMVSARLNTLPDTVLIDAKHRILDTISAIVSGAKLPPGEAAIRFIKTQGGTPEAAVITTPIRTTMINAALINGMLAHSDESDDFEPVTKVHPGSSTVSAALALAEKSKCSGIEFINAVALGYDVGCRFLMALGPDHVRGTHRGAEPYGATMGAMASAASLARFNELQMRYTISYAAQQVSGLWNWVNDEDHIEKSFDFSGMGSRNGVTAVAFVQSGMTGVYNALDSKHNVLDALSNKPNPEAMIADLGNRFYISESSIKTIPVGYPNQAPIDAFLKLARSNKLDLDNVEQITVKLPEDAIGIVSNSPMPDVNCQYLIATALVDGNVSFEHSHSREHMSNPKIKKAMARVQVIGDPKLNDPAAPRSGLVEIKLRNGTTLSEFTRFPPGTKENPLSTEMVIAKAQDLMEPVLGKSQTEKAIKLWLNIDKEKNMRAAIYSILKS